MQLVGDKGCVVRKLLGLHNNLTHVHPIMDLIFILEKPLLIHVGFCWQDNSR